MRMNNTKLLSQTIREGRKGDRKSRFGQTSQEQDLPNKSHEKMFFQILIIVIQAIYNLPIHNT
jgi:hypothetical protein